MEQLPPEQLIGEAANPVPLFICTSPPFPAGGALPAAIAVFTAFCEAILLSEFAAIAGSVSSV
jgi:hypothetical protein